MAELFNVEDREKLRLKDVADMDGGVLNTDKYDGVCSHRVAIKSDELSITLYDPDSDEVTKVPFEAHSSMHGGLKITLAKHFVDKDVKKVLIGEKNE